MTSPDGEAAGQDVPAPPDASQQSQNGKGTSAIDYAPDSGVGMTFVGPVGIAVIGVAVAAAMALAIYSLIALWPANSTTTAPLPSHLFRYRLLLDREQRLFCIVAIAGGLGGLIHTARSVYWYVGNRVLRRSWLLMYIFLPFVGSALSVVFYIILRGGVLPGAGDGAQVNFFGFTAIAALVGLFSPEAARKLQQIFATLFTPAESGRKIDTAPDKEQLPPGGTRRSSGS
jgi:hypothetical protein